jgi:hypothetical protein
MKGMIRGHPKDILQSSGNFNMFNDNLMAIGRNDTLFSKISDEKE